MLASRLIHLSHFLSLSACSNLPGKMPTSTNFHLPNSLPQSHFQTLTGLWHKMSPFGRAFNAFPTNAFGSQHPTQRADCFTGQDIYSIKRMIHFPTYDIRGSSESIGLRPCNQSPVDVDRKISPVLSKNSNMIA